MVARRPHARVRPVLDKRRPRRRGGHLDGRRGRVAPPSTDARASERLRPRLAPCALIYPCVAEPTPTSSKRASNRGSSLAGGGDHRLGVRASPERVMLLVCQAAVGGPPACCQGRGKLAARRLTGPAGRLPEVVVRGIRAHSPTFRCAVMQSSRE